MAKRKIVKNENVEIINEIEKVEAVTLKEEPVIEQKEETFDVATDNVEDTSSQKAEETFELVEEKPLIKNSIKNKKPLMFGYIWNGQEYD